MKAFVILYEYDKIDSVWSSREKAEARIAELEKDYQEDDGLYEELLYRNDYEIHEMMDSVFDS